MAKIIQSHIFENHPVHHGFYTRDWTKEDIAQDLGLPLHELHQVHSPLSVLWQPDMDTSTTQADGLICSAPGQAVAVYTADCLPVLFYEPKQHVIAAVHAGWKGALYGVLEQTIEKIVSMGGNVAELHVAIGPAIQQSSYEVSQDFAKPFLAQDIENESFFESGVKEGHLQFDLPNYAKNRLTKLGIKHLDSLDRDTYADEKRFYSYRRATKAGQSKAGRHYSVIALHG